MIDLGDKVRCKITGFTGIATAETFYINGCVRYLVTSSTLVDGDVKELFFDEQILEVVERHVLSSGNVKPNKYNPLSHVKETVETVMKSTAGGPQRTNPPKR